MKKYAFVLSMLLILIVIAAAHTFLYGGEYIGDASGASAYARGQNPGSGSIEINPPRKIPMPPVYAPKDTIILTVPPSQTLPPPPASPSPPPVPVNDPAENLAGKAVNILSGLYIDAEAAKRRPFALVFNNNEQALPQSGLSQADIIYEVLSEGTITRIIGIFQDFNSSKLGSIRSARHYFIDIALDYDAFFVHFGGSPQAYSALKDLKINNINGIYLDGGVKTSGFDKVVFWRDSTRYKTSSMREHSAYTSAKNLINQAAKAKYRLTKKEGTEGPFSFYDSRNNTADAANAKRISVSYANNNPAVFEYNEGTGLYSRFQNKGPKAQTDEETGKQITVNNVIVQLTSVKSIPGDTEGRREIAVVGSGKGYLFTNGTVVALRWSKTSHFSPTVWTFENGEKLTLNKGKTWICITNKVPEYK